MLLFQMSGITERSKQSAEKPRSQEELKSQFDKQKEELKSQFYDFCLKFYRVEGSPQKSAALSGLAESLSRLAGRVGRLKEDDRPQAAAFCEAAVNTIIRLSSADRDISGKAFAISQGLPGPDAFINNSEYLGQLAQAGNYFAALEYTFKYCPRDRHTVQALADALNEVRDSKGATDLWTFGFRTEKEAKDFSGMLDRLPGVSAAGNHRPLENVSKEGELEIPVPSLPSRWVVMFKLQAAPEKLGELDTIKPEPEAKEVEQAKTVTVKKKGKTLPIVQMPTTLVQQRVNTAQETGQSSAPINDVGVDAAIGAKEDKQSSSSGAVQSKTLITAEMAYGRHFDVDQADSQENARRALVLTFNSLATKFGYTIEPPYTFPEWVLTGDGQDFIKKLNDALEKGGKPLQLTGSATQEVIYNGTKFGTWLNEVKDNYDLALERSQLMIDALQEINDSLKEAGKAAINISTKATGKVVFYQENILGADKLDMLSDKDRAFLVKFLVENHFSSDGETLESAYRKALETFGFDTQQAHERLNSLMGYLKTKDTKSYKKLAAVLDQDEKTGEFSVSDERASQNKLRAYFYARSAENPEGMREEGRFAIVKNKPKTITQQSALVRAIEKSGDSSARSIRVENSVEQEISIGFGKVSEESAELSASCELLGRPSQFDGRVHAYFIEEGKAAKDKVELTASAPSDDGLKKVYAFSIPPELRGKTGRIAAYAENASGDVNSGLAWMKVEAQREIHAPTVVVSKAIDVPRSLPKVIISGYDTITDARDPNKKRTGPIDMRVFFGVVMHDSDVGQKVKYLMYPSEADVHDGHAYAFGGQMIPVERGLKTDEKTTYQKEQVQDMANRGVVGVKSGNNWVTLDGRSTISQDEITQLKLAENGSALYSKDAKAPMLQKVKVLSTTESNEPNIAVGMANPIERTKITTSVPKETVLPSKKVSIGGADYRPGDIRDLADENIFAIVGRNSRNEDCFFNLNGQEIGLVSELSSGGVPNLPGASMRIPKSQLSEQNHYQIEQEVYIPKLHGFIHVQVRAYSEQGIGTMKSQTSVGGKESGQ